MGIKYTSLTKKAMMICFETHKNQKDKSGMPYVYHPFHLAEQMETEDEICTALLHDVAEDSDCTIEDLKKEGFSADTIEALRLLTHEKSVPYMDYIAALKGNPIARKVKLVDRSYYYRQRTFYKSVRKLEPLGKGKHHWREENTVSTLEQ